MTSPGARRKRAALTPPVHSLGDTVQADQATNVEAVFNDQVLNGQGFAIIDIGHHTGGKKLEELPPQIVNLLRFLGRPAEQCGDGRLHHVIRVDRDPDPPEGPAEPFPSTPDEFELHTDAAFLGGTSTVVYVAMYCHASASSGGETLLMDGHLIINDLASATPDVLTRMYEPFPFAALGAGPADDPDKVTWAPVLTRNSDQTSIRLHRWRIRSGYQQYGQQADQTTERALAALDHSFGQTENAQELLLQPGHLLILDNQRILHARRSYIDNPSHPRTLLRFWFQAPHYRGGTYSGR